MAFRRGPYGERRSRAEIDANHPWLVGIGFVVTLLSIIAQIALVPRSAAPIAVPEAQIDD